MTKPSPGRPAVLPANLARLLLACLLLICVSTASQALDMAAPLPLDAGVTFGQLPNGLTYYIRRNLKPEQRAQMWLVVNTGSVDEDDDQQGLAHFCEHMAFNGTRRYPKNDLIKVLEAMGIPFGSEVNAATGFDATTYRLEVPTDKPELVEEGLRVLVDWASGITFADTEIEKERGVILEELRLYTGARTRIRDQQFPVILPGTKYANRLPIGKREILTTFRRDTLIRYYRDWYRPDLQAIIIVGDIDPAAIAAMISEHFGGLPAPVNPRPREHYGIPDNREPLVSILTDTEATSINFCIDYKHARTVTRTVADLRGDLTRMLFSMMLNRRLQEITLKPESPLLSGSVEFAPFLGRDLSTYSAYATPKEDQVDTGIALLLAENERVRRFGFVATELAREKTNLLRSLESAVQERDKTHSSSYVSDYVSHFTTGTTFTDIMTVYQLANELLPEIALPEVCRLAAEWMTDSNIIVTITAPNRPGLPLPDRDRIISLLQAARERQLAAYVDLKTAGTLLETVPVAVPAQAITYNQELDCYELQFRNGLKVIVKATDFKNDEILFSAFSYGGSSLYDLDDLMSATLAVPIIRQSGLGRFDLPSLSAALAGKIASVQPYLGTNSEGFSGAAAARDYETLMQLLHLYFTAPRADSAVFAAQMAAERQAVRYLREDPGAVYSEACVLAVTSNDSRSIVIPTAAQLDQASCTRLAAIFRERFANASDFTFTFVGSFDTPAAIALAETYLGSLDLRRQEETWRDVSPRFPDGVVTLAVRKGLEDKAASMLCMKGDIPWTFANRLRLRILAEVLNIRFREIVREEQSGVYGISATIDAVHYPRATYEFTVRFGCAPARVDELVGAVFAELNKMLAEGPAASELERVKEILLRQRETALRENSFWVYVLEFLRYNRDTTTRIMEYPDAVARVTAAEIRDVARTVITPDHYVRVDLLPETGHPAVAPIQPVTPPAQ